MTKKTLSVQDLISQKKQEIEAKKGRARTWKPAKGKSRIRVLPSWRLGDPQFFHDFGQHFVKNSKGDTEAIYLCSDKTFGNDCDVCNAIGAGIKNSHDDDTVKLLKQANSSQKYLMNVLVLTDPDEAKRNEPQIMEAGMTVFEAICEIISEYGDITSLTEGVDLVITREGTGQFDTKYTVMPSPKSVKVPESILEKLHDLDEYVAQENDDAKRKAVNAVGRAAGLLTADTPSAGALPSSNVDDEMIAVDDGTADQEEAVDADFTEIVEAEVEDAPLAAEETAESTEIDGDDLDDLLAELG